MRRNKRPIPLLIVAILSTLGLLGLLFFVSPTTSVPLFFFSLPAVFFFLSLVAIVAYSSISYLFRSKKHGYLVSIFVILYFLFRIWNLSHPFFFFLLLALFLTLELVFTSKKQ